MCICHQLEQAKAKNTFFWQVTANKKPFLELYMKILGRCWLYWVEQAFARKVVEL
jgi:hypothetical protein